jgi:hypothetical protein
MKLVGLHRLIDKITDNAMCEGSRNIPSCYNSSMPGTKRGPLSKSDMPGYRIMQLSHDEREVLTHAKAEDFSWRGFR